MPADRPSSRAVTPERILYVAAAILYVALGHCFAKQTGDDSFIYYRIADNVLDGHGPVFNPGEHVEAYSSPLWLLLLVAGKAIGLGYGTLARLLGHALSLVGIVSGAMTARRLGASAVASALVVLFLALSGTLHYWTPSGLETSLHLALIGLLSVGIATESPRLYVVAAALVGVSRPEGMFLVPIAAVAYLVAHGRRALTPWALAAALLPAAGYEIFRLAYFHAPLANTYYAKATGPLAQRLALGLDYAMWTLTILVPAAIYALVRARRGDMTLLAVLLVPGALVAAAIVGGGDWMWGRRLLLPALPTIFAATLVAIEGALAGRSRRVQLALAVAAPLVAINDDLPWPDRLGYVLWFDFNPENLVFKRGSWGDITKAADLRFVRPIETVLGALAGRTIEPSQRMEGTMTDVARDVGAFLVQRYGSGALLAVNHAGAVPFYARLPTVDMVGLADWHIAHEVKGGLHAKFDPDYVLARKPRAIVLNSRTEPGKDGVWYHEGYWEGETALVRRPEFAARYRALPVYFRWEYADHGGNFILVYERIEP